MQRTFKENNLTDATLKALADRDLDIEIIESTELPPMIDSKIIVGREGHLPLTTRDVEVDDCEWFGGVQANVTIYLDKKGLDSKDVVWWPIYKYNTNGKVDYSTQSNTKDFHSDDCCVGFAIMLMSDFIVETKDGFMITRLVEQARDRLELELMVLAHWQNKDIYNVNLKLKGKLVQSKRNVLLTAGMLDVVANTMVHRFDADKLESFMEAHYEQRNLF